MKNGGACKTEAIYNVAEGVVCGFTGQESCGTNLGGPVLGINDGELIFLYIFLGTTITCIF